MDRGVELSEYPPVPADATGYIAATPIRSIAGPKSGLHYILSIALNGKGQVSVQEVNSENQDPHVRRDRKR